VIARVLLVIILGLILDGCGAPTLHPADWGRPAAAATSLRRLVIVAMPSPRLDKPLEGDLVPTAYLAQVAADYLKERVEAVDTSRAGAGTAVTWGGVRGWVSMEQFLGRARAWYSEANSQIDYSDRAARGIDGVIEIGVANYEVFFGSLLVQVVVKLVDPATGAVLGKARAAAHDKIDPLTPEQFKLIFAQAAATPTADNLQRVGLTPRGGASGR
jgi:hypothetical protein